MVCAYVHPTFDKLLQAIDGLEARRRRMVRVAIVAGSSPAGLPPPICLGRASCACAAGLRSTLAGLPLCMPSSHTQRGHNQPLPPLHPAHLARTPHGAAALAVGAVWYSHVYVLPKREYNVLHPYTSWIPISVRACAYWFVGGAQGASGSRPAGRLAHHCTLTQPGPHLWQRPRH